MTLGIVRLSSVAIIALVTGCAEMNSIQYAFMNDKDRTLTIDAKQRIVTVNTTGGPGEEGRLVVCAEKSPDVFSVISSSSGLSVETLKANVALSTALAESGADISLRTQLTQLQAEFLYRLCEQYSNGAIDDIQVETQLRRFQHITLASLAVEQLTLPFRPKATQTLLTTSSASIGQDVAAAEQALREAESELEKEQTEEGKLKKAYDDGKCGAENKDSDACKKASADWEAQTAKVKAAQQKVKDREQGFSAARLAQRMTASGIAGATVNVFGPFEAPKVSTDVANAVQGIVYNAVNQTYLVDTCSQAFVRKNPPDWITNAAHPGHKLCNEVLDDYKDAWVKRQTELAVLLEKATPDTLPKLLADYRAIVEQRGGSVGESAPPYRDAPLEVSAPAS